jgi:hypothetical protein
MTVGAAKFGLFAAAGSGAAAFTAFGGIITQWKGAASVITDSSAADNNGTTTGVRYSTAATKSGTYGLRSVDFGDPPRGYVRAPTMSTLGMTTAFTVSCWAKADTHPVTWTCLFGQSSTSHWPDGFGMYVSGTNTIKGWVNGHGSNMVADTVTFTNWNHYVLTYDGSNLKLYINGSLEDTAANSGTIASRAIGIADLHATSDDYSWTWPGVSDEWGFWNEALTAAEITAIYNSGTPLSLSSDSGNYASSANLKAYYKFEDPKTYRVHTFRGSGKFYVSSGAADVDYLIIAGGGSAGRHIGGGGGAGGVLTGTGVAVSAGTYPVTVGTGGTAARTATNTHDGDGVDSSALSETATGGGGGGCSGSAPTDDGKAGGSGGGGNQNGTSNQGGTGIAGPPRQGYDGGDSGNGSYGGGGGGGFGAAGSNGTTTYVGGNGGNGATGYGITATTPNYAGGGGGGGHGAAAGTGGTGGGGAGNNTNGGIGGGGVPNTGGGGGGSGNDGFGGFGATGIVTIRYEVEAA